MYSIDRIVFNTDENYIKLDANKVLLDKQTSNILQLLIETKSPVSKEVLLNKIWQNRFVSDAAITSAIRRVRKALAELDDTKEYIKTISKVGYQINVPINQSILPNKVQKKQIISRLNYIFIAVCFIFLSGMVYWLLSSKASSDLPTGYQQALHLIATKEEKFLPQAIDLLEITIKNKPNFVAAYHSLSQLYAYKMSRHLQLTDEQIITKAQYYIDKSKKLAPTHPETYLSQAILDYFYLRDIKGVEKFHQLVKQGLKCNHSCNYYLAYSAPVLNQAEQGVLYAEQAYQAKPYNATYTWERAWSLFMLGDFQQTVTRIEEAELFVGRTSYLFRAMLAQSQQQYQKAIIYWLSYFHSAEKLTKIDLGRFKTLAQEKNYSEVSKLLLEQLTDIPIDQEVELLLLAGRKQAAINRVLGTKSLQEQTYLMAMHVSPLFTINFTLSELEEIRRYIWKLN